MKTLFIIMCSISMLHFANAQMEVSEAKRAMSSGMHNSFMVELSEIPSNEAEDSWKKFTDPYSGKLKNERKAKEWVLTDAKVPSLSENVITIYSKFLESAKGLDVQTGVVIWFEIDNGFANTAENIALGASAKAIVHDYAMTTLKNHAESVLSAEQKKVEELQKKLKNLQKDKKDYQKKLSDAEKTISEMKKNIESNDFDQANVEKMIVDQKKTVRNAEKEVSKFRQ